MISSSSILRHLRARDKINDALRGYRELHLRSARLLTDGLLATFSCSHHVSAKEFESSVAAGFFDAKRSARIIRRLVQGPDHPVLLHMPETFYLKGLFLGVPMGRMIFVLEISVPDRQSLVGSKFYMPPDPSKVSGPYLDLEEENAEDLGEEVQKTNTELEKLSDSSKTSRSKSCAWRSSRSVRTSWRPGAPR